MEHDNFSRTDTEFQPHSMFKQDCSSWAQLDNWHMFEAVTSKDGKLIASRAITWDEKTLGTSQVIDFESDGKKYELQDDFKGKTDIFLDTTGADGKRVLTPVDAKSDEYKNALATNNKIDYDHLPDCGSVYEGT